MRCLFLFEPQGRRSLDDTERVGVAHSAPPSLHTDDGIASVENLELQRLDDAPFESAVNVLLPRYFLEIWLFLVEDERVNATVQMRILTHN
jgi:hypothetical protein